MNLSLGFGDVINDNNFRLMMCKVIMFFLPSFVQGNHS